MKKLFFYLNKYRHPSAIILTLVGTFLIHRFTLFLYFPPNTKLSYIETANHLWASSDLFFQFLAIMNFLIKPLMIYVLYIYLFKCLRVYTRHAS